MMMSTSTSAQTISLRDPGAQPTWYRVYFVLAAFDILTVCASLSMNHRLMGMYESSVETNRVWANRLAAFADINSLAVQTNAPGNDVFESRDPDEASARLDARLDSFSIAIEAARQELQQNLGTEAAPPLLAHLDKARTAMQVQIAEARSIFAHVRANDMNRAGERMAAMDRAFYAVTEALAAISGDIQGRQHDELGAQASVAVSFRRIEYLIAALVLLMVSIAVVYGHKLALRAKETGRQAREMIERIETTNMELEGQKGEAEAMNAELRKSNAALEVARAEAASSTRAKSDFLANMSHEIRTPMTAILGFAESLLDTEQSESERMSCVHTIRRNGEYLLGLINDILDLSKIEAGKMAVEHRNCKPCEIIAEVVSLMRVRSEARGLPFRIEYVGAIPEIVRSDATRLRQILINLIGNAIKFTASGDVRLVTRFVQDGDGSRLQFDVIDTGRGMSPEQSAKLFQPFTQADTSTTRNFGGTGLGLTISKRFAEMLGGDMIVAESELGVGSTFRATIATGPLDGVRMIEDPMAVTVVPETAGAPAQSTLTGLQGLRILLGEDGPDNQRLITFVLKKAGADVTVKENGKLALDAALAAREEGKPFDVILMDMQMPVMDGYTATAQLRHHGYTGPIISLTAHAMASDREKCINAGCDDFATKPIERQKLIETIQQHLVPAEAMSPTAT